MRRKVFGIGLHRCGTQSLHRLMQASGLRAIHWPAVVDGDDLQSSVVGHEADRPRVMASIAHLLPRYDAFGDVPFCALYDDLLARVPDASFVALTRPPEGWTASVRRHMGERPFDPYERVLYWRYFDHRPPGLDALDDSQLMAMFEAHYLGLARAVPARQLLTVDLFDPQAGAAICDFLEVPRRDLPKVDYRLENPSAGRSARPLPQRLLNRARVVASREQILGHLRKGGVFCEVGAALGDFTAQALALCEPSRVLAIDDFVLHRFPGTWGGEVGRRLGDTDHRTYFERRFAPEIADGRLRIFEGESLDVLARMMEGSVDAVSLAAHLDYEAVWADLTAAARLLGAGGTIIVDNYIRHDHLTGTPYAVVPAVHDFMLDRGWDMRFLALHAEMFCSVALMRVDAG